MKLLSRLTINASRLTARHLAFALFLLPFTFFLLPPKSAFAAETKETFYTQQYQSIKNNLTSPPPNEVNNTRFAKNSFDNLLAAGIGFGTLDQNGAVADLGNAMAMLTKRPPVQTKEYLAYMAGKAGFIDQAYAQQQRGGFDVLGPIQKLWIATRNIAYLITSLTLVVIGFMIMLRKKIDAQTVIGVQQALPKLVVTLLLITFSYAIAGFLIDMIYWLSFFGIKLLALNGIFDDSGVAAINTIKTKSIFSIGIRDIFRLGGGSTGTAETAADAVGNLVKEILGGGMLGKATEIISQPIAYVIFAVAILYAVFKLFFALLMSYIQIILLSILGPLQLMMNALPGSDAFSKWFRNLLANVMAFPAAILMLIFSAALMGQTGEHFRIAPDIGFTDVTKGVKWIPPLLFGEGSGAGGSANPVDAVVGLLGIGILLMTPKVVDMVKEWVQAPEFKYGSAIGEAVGFGYNIGVKRPVGTGYGMYEKEKEYEKQAALFSQGRIGGQEARQQLYGVDNRAGVRAGRVKTFFRSLVVGK